MTNETRFHASDVELRTVGSGMTVTGYAAIFDATARPFGSFKESVAPGAFKRSLNSGKDVPVLFSHDPNKFLGRTSSGTARISEDEKGLHYEVDLPNTSEGRDVAELIERGDVRGSSFGFRSPTGKQSAWEIRDGERVRVLRELALLDVGPTPFPAYEETDAQVRSALHTLADAEDLDLDVLIAAHSDPDEFRSFLVESEQTTVAEAVAPLDIDMLIASKMAA